MQDMFLICLQYLACLSSSSSCDKLAFDVGLQEESGAGEACWWTVHPSSKQRSEGEKVRVGDDAILVSVATERYLVSDIRDSWCKSFMPLTFHTGYSDTVGAHIFIMLTKSP